MHVELGIRGERADHARREPGVRRRPPEFPIEVDLIRIRPSRHEARDHDERIVVPLHAERPLALSQDHDLAWSRRLDPDGGIRFAREAVDGPRTRSGIQRILPYGHHAP